VADQLTVLLIDSDDNERDILVEAALEPSGYDVLVATDGGEGLSLALDSDPTVIILDLNVEGLSAQDVLAALQVQSVNIPVVLLADAGAEKEALTAFRLGATDYLLRPVREAEMIQVIERAIVRWGSSEALPEAPTTVEYTSVDSEAVEEAEAAKAAAATLLRELQTLMDVGQAVTGSVRIEELFDHVIRAAAQLSNADSAGLMLKVEGEESFILQGGQNLESDLLDKVGEPVEDAVASMVNQSYETYYASGEELEDLTLLQQGVGAILYAPLTVNREPLGALWIAKEGPSEITAHATSLVEALANYAALAVYNSIMQKRQVEAAVAAPEPEPVEESPADVSVQMSGLELARRLREPLIQLRSNFNLFRKGEMGPLPPNHQAAIDVLHRQIQQLVDLVDSLIPPSDVNV